MDMLFIGPADLSASLGAFGDFAARKFVDAFAAVEGSILDSGKWLGCIPFHDWDAERLYRNGHHLVLSGADTLLLRQAAKEDVAELDRMKKSAAD
jgi:2-keto-3-deoxy-L-rhamnonate aldolase RhmA